MELHSPIMHSFSISRRAAENLERGHLWIFSNEIQKKENCSAPGDWCYFEFNGRIMGTGYFNRHSLIAGRIVDFGKSENISDLLRNRLRAAFLKRKAAGLTGAVRLVFSEGDFFPGLVVDAYEGSLVFQSSTAGMDRLLPFLEIEGAALFEKVFNRRVDGIVSRGDSAFRVLENLNAFCRVVKGNEKDLRQVEFKENDTTYVADLVQGQKTGFFMDQRENRMFFGNVVETVPGASVLDLYCYSGAWGLLALKKGAMRVAFVDQSGSALSLVESSALRNGIPPEKMIFFKADVFKYLQNESNTFDIIVADPPAFIKSTKVFHQGLKAYEKLNRLAWRRLRAGGWLFSSSCSRHLSEPDFLDLLRRAVARENGLAHIGYRGFQAADHPVLLSMPETLYLKCVGLQKIR